MTIVMGAQWFIAVAIDIVLLVVTISVIRRHRPDAYPRFLAWAVAGLASGILLPLVRTLMPVLTRNGIESFYRLNTLTTIFGTAVHIGVVALLVRALVTIAQPPKTVTTAPVGPYR